MELEETIKRLIAVQDCDGRIHKIMRQKADIPVRLEKMAQGLSETESVLEMEIQEVDAQKKKKRELDRAIDEFEERIKKSQNKLSAIKSNKEYQAAQKEITDLQGEKRHLEESALEMMETMEEAERRRVAATVRIEAARKHFEEERRGLEAERDVLERNLARLEKEKAGLRVNMDTPVLARYDLLWSKKGGVAVSSVIRGVCQACRLGIPPQHFRELIRCDKLMACPHCKRLIYWGEDARFSPQGAETSEG